jgi:hypothetical protein
MHMIFAAIAATGMTLLIYALHMRRGHGTNDEEGEVQQRLEDEKDRLADEPPLPIADEDSWLTQQSEPDLERNENVTLSLTNAAPRSRCPACGAIITVHDERCPSCDIAFVADGSQQWTLGAVGPADGIFLPPTEVKK